MEFNEALSRQKKKKNIDCKILQLNNFYLDCNEKENLYKKKGNEKYNGRRKREIKYYKQSSWKIYYEIILKKQNTFLDLMLFGNFVRDSQSKLFGRHFGIPFFALVQLIDML